MVAVKEMEHVTAYAASLVVEYKAKICILLTVKLRKLRSRVFDMLSDFLSSSPNMKLCRKKSLIVLVRMLPICTSIYRLFHQVCFSHTKLIYSKNWRHR